MLSREILEAHLRQPFRYYDSVDSTNDLAKHWLRAGAAAGSVVIADEQRKGRGRMGRTWHTPPGVALALSVIMKPTPGHAHQISLLGALAVAELCETLGIAHVGIKWPNDVQIQGKKVSGVLPEAVWENDALLGVVLGIGVNVRVDFDAELSAVATSIEPLVKHKLDRAELIATLLDSIQARLPKLGTDALFKDWKRRLNMLGEPVQVGDTAGIAQDVEPSGALLIQQADGSIQRVLAGDLLMTPPPSR